MTVSRVLISRVVGTAKGRAGARHTYYGELEQLGVRFNAGWPYLLLKEAILNCGEILILKVFQGQKSN